MAKSSETIKQRFVKQSCNTGSCSEQKILWWMACQSVSELCMVVMVFLWILLMINFLKKCNTIDNIRILCVQVLLKGFTRYSLNSNRSVTLFWNSFPTANMVLSGSWPLFRSFIWHSSAKSVGHCLSVCRRLSFDLLPRPNWIPWDGGSWGSVPSIFKSGSTVSVLGRGSGPWFANLSPKSHGSFGVGPLGLSLVNTLIV